jgi:hypothetical protein
MAAKQAFFQEQLNNTASGDAAGENMEEGGWRRKLQEGVSEETATPLKPGEAPQPKLTPEQTATVQELQNGKQIAANDPRVAFITTLSEKQLKDVGLEKFKGEGDKEFYKYMVPAPSEEEVKQSLASSSGMKQIIDTAAAKNNIDPRIMYGIVRGESIGKTSGEYDVGDNRQSFGPFQMYMGGGLGNNFQRDTGLDPRNMSTLPQQADWIAKEIAKRGGGDAARKWVASQWYGYGKQQLGQTGTPYNINERASVGDSDWNSNWFKSGVYTKMGASKDPITQDYTSEQVAAEREKLVREINTNRIQSLARYSQANLPVPGSPEAQQFLSDGKSEAAVRKRISELTGMESKECVALAKAYVGATGTVRDWRKGSNVLDGNLKPGTPIATFMDREGNPSQYYDGGVGTGKRGNDTTHAAVFLGYERDQTGKITGIRVADQWSTSNGVRYRTFPIEGNSRITSAKNFYAINDTKGEPLGESNPMRVIEQSQQHQGGPKTESVADPTNITEKVQSSRQAVRQGSLSFEGGGTYHFGSGRPDDTDHPSTPLGSSPVGGFNPHHVPGGYGYEMPSLNNKFDPKVGRTRDGMVIHSSGHDDLQRLYSHGCISIPKSEFPAFQQEMENFKKAHDGKAYINIMPDGRVTVTASPAYSEDGTFIKPVTTDQAIKEIRTNQPQVVESSTQVRTGDVTPPGSVGQERIAESLRTPSPDVSAEPRPAPTGGHTLNEPAPNVGQGRIGESLGTPSPDVSAEPRPAPTGGHTLNRPGTEPTVGGQNVNESLRTAAPDVPQDVKRPAPTGGQTLNRPETPTPKTERKAPETSSLRYNFDEAAFVAEVREKEFGAALVSDDYILSELRNGFKNTPGVSYKNGVLTVNDPKSPAIQQVLQDMKNHNFDSSKFLHEIKEKTSDRGNTTETPETKAVSEQTINSPTATPETNIKVADASPKEIEQSVISHPVMTNEKGGENKTQTDQISAMPIGGIKSDNSVVVDANQKPLFTMNTEKEAAVYNPTKRNVDVIPKSSTIGKTPSSQSNMQSEMDILRSDIMSLKEGKQNPAQDITKGSESHITDRDGGMIENIMSMTKHIFLDPSAARAYSRARFVETGDSTNDFHHSGGNSNMKN